MRFYNHLIFLLLYGIVCQNSAGYVQTPQVYSTSMKKAYTASIVLPESYKTTTTTKYKVLYLLHGYSGNYATWLLMVPLTTLADKYSLIIVCIDGNYNSWYLDSPVKSNSRFETYVTKEVVSYIDSTYRTIATKQGRAICGSSMGGHGALTLLAKHPDLYSVGTSISGVFDLTQFPNNWEISEVLGDANANKKNWLEHSFIGCYMLLAGKNKKIFLDCGTEDFASFGNKQMHELLTKNAISHKYNEQPGNHSPAYVAKVFESHLVFIVESMR